LACGSLSFAALMLLPSIFFVDYALIDLRIVLSLLGLGILCTGIAYIFYFKLAAEESARVVVSVVLLIPFFGTIIGAVFAHETITLNKIIGCLAILVSMKFILNLSRKNFFKSKEPHVL
jgi:drug/metabolite transporter (DMT)-like permease